MAEMRVLKDRVPELTEFSQQQAADLYRFRRSTILALAGYSYRAATTELTQPHPVILRPAFWLKGTSKSPVPYFDVAELERVLGPLLIRKRDIAEWKLMRSKVRNRESQLLYQKRLAARNGRDYVLPEKYTGKAARALGDPWIMPETVARFGEVDIFADIRDGKIKPNKGKGAVLLSDVVELYGPAIEFVMMSNGFYRRTHAEFAKKPGRNEYLTPREVYGLYWRNADPLPNPGGSTHFKLLSDVVAAFGPLPFRKDRVEEWSKRYLAAGRNDADMEYCAVVMNLEERGKVETSR